MRRLLLVAALFVSGAAWACPGNPNCGSCPMPTASAATTAPLPDGTRGYMDVTGMKCGECSNKVHHALMGVDGVRGANVDHATGKVEVSFDEKKTNLDALLKAVNATGYQAKAAPAPAPAK